MTTKHNMEALVRSLTGFDEIAIEKYFGKRFEDINGNMLARAVLFIANHREGMPDPVAHKTAMDVPLGDLESYFETPQDEDSAEFTAELDETPKA